MSQVPGVTGTVVWVTESHGPTEVVQDPGLQPDLATSSVCCSRLVETGPWEGHDACSQTLALGCHSGLQSHSWLTGVPCGDAHPGSLFSDWMS